MTLVLLSAFSLAARLGLVALAGQQLLTACTLPPGRLRRRHAVFGGIVLAGAVIRF